jgi:hypothetical protein
VFSTVIAYLLFFIGGFGALGLHRFYLRKIGTGVLYALTGGLAGIGCIYDFFTLPMQVRDANTEDRYRRALEMQSPRPIRDARDTSLPAKVNRESIERTILKTAKANNGIAPASEVALAAEISLDDAKKKLEQLVSKGFAEVRVSKTGQLLYVFPDFTTEETESRLEDF